MKIYMKCVIVLSVHGIFVFLRDFFIHSQNFYRYVFSNYSWLDNLSITHPSLTIDFNHDIYNRWL